MVGVSGDLVFLLDSGLDTRFLHHFGNGVLAAGGVLRKEFPVNTRRAIIVVMLRIVNDFNLLLERLPIL